MTASAQQFQKVRLFLSSPGDVEPEREIVHKTAKIINNMLSDSFNMVLEVIDWKTHIVPNMGRPQELINEQVGDYDIFVGILWKRFGTPTGVAESGTEEEFYIAYENWKNYQRPRIMFYFSQVPFMPRIPDEIEQMSKVLNFKSKFWADKDNPGLIFEYASVDEFGELIQSHLVKVLQEMFKKKDLNSEFVGFTSYLRYLKQETMYIDIRGLVTGKDKVDQFAIDDLYIPLKTRYSAQHERSQPGEVQEMETRLEEALLKEQRLFIKGEPGAGKTTFLRLIAYTLCQARLGGTVKSQLIVPDSLPLPLFIRVGMLSRYISKYKNQEGFSYPSEPGSPEWLIHFLASQSQAYNWGLSADNFRAELRKGPCMILIDGLDEAANEDERGDISRLASNLVIAYRDCQIVLTSRPSALTTGDIVPLDFHTVEIAALDEAGIRSFLDKWCSVLYDKAPDKSKQYKEELSQALNSHREIRRMSGTPVMLTALAVVHWNEHRLPQQRAELYESVLTWLFKARKDREGRLSVAQCRELLQKLALSMFTHKEGRLRTVDIWEGAKMLVPDFEKNQKAADRFLRDEMIDSGIIVERNERLEYWHLSFQEYLSAYEIGGMSDEEQLKVLFEDTRLYKPEWREVMLLLAGVLHRQGKPRINHLINAIIEKGPKTATQDTLPELAREVGLLGGIVNDLSPYNFEPSHDRYKTIVRSVMGIFDKKTFRSIPVQVRIEAADALGRVGDPRFDRKDDLWVRIPAGSFWMGAQKNDPKGRNYDSEASDKESPVHEVELTAYRIGKYPVTVYQFRQFIEDGGYEDKRYWGAGGFGEFRRPGNWEKQLHHPTRPVVYVSWFEAKAYTSWVGCRLPTEAQWERAAQGAGQEYRKYPWGNEEPDKETMNFSDSGIGHPTPVGIFPESCSPEGVIDISGNIQEWCEDIYSYNAYSKHIKKKPISTSGIGNVFRGGSWGSGPVYARCANRNSNLPARHSSGIGFRLLRT